MASRALGGDGMLNVAPRRARARAGRFAACMRARPAQCVSPTVAPLQLVRCALPCWARPCKRQGGRARRRRWSTRPGERAGCSIAPLPRQGIDLWGHRAWRKSAGEPAAVGRGEAHVHVHGACRERMCTPGAAEIQAQHAAARILAMSPAAGARASACTRLASPRARLAAAASEPARERSHDEAALTGSQCTHATIAPALWPLRCVCARMSHGMCMAHVRGECTQVFTLSRCTASLTSYI